MLNACQVSVNEVSNQYMHSAGNRYHEIRPLFVKYHLNPLKMILYKSDRKSLKSDNSRKEVEFHSTDEQQRAYI